MSTFYLARQPILDVENNTYGYELLFRSTTKNSYDPSVDGDTATARVLVNSIVEAGLDSIVGNSRAFVNLTEYFLENPEMLDLLEPGSCVLEILEDVIVTDSVFAGVRALHAKGHTIALDDFVDAVQFTRLMPLVHIIKYDITQHTMEELAALRLKDAAAGRLSLAERVETHEEYDTLKAAGFQYYQGYFFAKPHVISGSKLPQNRVAILQLLGQINDPASSIYDIAETLSHDVALSVRTLKYVNSPLSALKSEVTSISHAAVLLGREPIRNWVILLVMTGIEDKPQELTKMALVRARFCQLLSLERELGDDGKYFTIGLLSLVGVLMDLELGDALDQFSITGDLRSQILDLAGPGGEMLKLVSEIEKPEPEVELEDPAIGQIYQNSISWAEQLFGML